jgi:hypothetical protein
VERVAAPAEALREGRALNALSASTPVKRVEGNAFHPGDILFHSFCFPTNASKAARATR